MRFPIQLQPRGRQRFDALGVGVNTTDMLVVISDYPRVGSKIQFRKLEILPGGQAATAMTAVSRLGWSARYVGCFGDDENGSSGRLALAGDGVDVSACTTIAGATNRLSIILVDEKSGQRTVLHSGNPSLHLGPEHISPAVLCSARIVLVDCQDLESSAEAARIARHAKVPTVVDVERVCPGIEDLLHNIDIIITAEEFPEALTGSRDLGSALREIQRKYNASMVCTTLGQQGSVALVGESEIRTNGFKVPVADTTGAGDVFRGGFIAGWLRGGLNAQVEEVLRYANAAAALKCRALGARTAIPNADEVEALVNRGERKGLMIR